VESFPGPEYMPNPSQDPTVPLSAAPSATMPPVSQPATAPQPPFTPPSATASRAGLGVALVVVVTIVATAAVASLLSPALTQARVNAYPQPSVAISVQGGSPSRVGDAIQFAAQVNAGHDLTFNWDFGDGASATGAVTSHAYSQYGSFTVRLVANDPIGQYTTATSQISVLPPPPQACFTAASEPDYPFTVDFDASCSSGAQLQYYWDFGDGSGDTSGGDQQAQNTYAQLGTYHVTLRVVDAAGQSNTATQDVQVTLPMPTASFTISNDFGDCFSFDASASTGYQLTYNWDFGDGGVSDGNSYPDASNCYLSPGTYTVHLIVVDAGNQSARTTQTLIAP
jgi:PKD repeat protein